VWLSDGRSVFASKLLVPGKAPGFNDEGSLQVNIPSSAGRVVALEQMDEKLVILCERGVYISQGQGPDNLGNGTDFIPPIHLADLGLAGSRASVFTEKGILFVTPGSSNDGQFAGPWLLDRGLGLNYLGRAVAGTWGAGTATYDTTYSAERQEAFIAVPGTGTVVWDMRFNKWATWTAPDTTNTAYLVCVGDKVWQLGVEPGAYFGGPKGVDVVAGPVNFSMTYTGTHLAANGQDGLGWARIRSARLLGTQTTPHTLTMSALVDQSMTITSPAFSIVTTTGDSAWPTGRYAPEWRLPIQKASEIQFTLSATPAVATWSELELSIKPLSGYAPPAQRG
jgi:hypothetical protein